MARAVLERGPELAELGKAVQEAAAGGGSVVLIYGEAGIGKSSLVQAVRGRIPPEGRMLVGQCDDLSTPRILGPFHDLIGAVGAELTAALRDAADRDRILSALRGEFDRSGRPTVLVVEDVHWADEATLDLLRYLARRVGPMRLLLILTYRDDGLARGHPLRQLLGLLSGSPHTRRLPLRRLSPGAVRELSAGSAVDADEVFEVTAGNPFFVTEVLAAGPGVGVPRSVVDAVLGRFRDLTGPARAAVEQLSVVPTAIDRRLVGALLPGGLSTLAAAEERGLVSVSADRVAFRHELTRRAIADSLPVAQRTLLNGRILSTLTAGRRGGTHHPRDDLARIMHHAAEAGDDAAIVRYGPSAARAAAEDGAHREAVAHYQLILAHRTWFGPPERVELLERAAIECYTVGVRGAEALALQRDAVSLRRDLGDAPALGASLRWLSRIAWFCGDRVLAEATAEEAIAVLTEAGDLASLAMAFSNQAQLDMLADRHHEAIAAAERAIVLARQTENAAALSHALNNLGTARWSLGDPDGRRALAESLRVALAAGQLEHACRAYANVIWGLLADLRPAEAETWVREAMDVADRAEHLLFWQYFNVEHAMVALAGARWGEAVMHAARGLDAPGGVRCAGLTVLSRVAVRTGRTVRTGGIGEAGEAEVDETWRLACGIGELQRTGPAAAVVCEDAWLRGDLARVREVAVPVYQEACRLGFPEKAAELELWLARAGEPVARTSPAHPHGLHAAGRWREAAAAWRQAGYPYESAAALADSPAVPDRLTALAALDELGARPLAERVRRELRAEGVAAPRGPLATTRENPAHLTRRQLEVISLLNEGLTNAEIADRLVVSVRTVDNHVAAVLEKLGVHSREEAVARGRELGIRTT